MSRNKSTIVLIVLGLFVSFQAVFAQDPQPEGVPIEFGGTVESVDGTTLTLGGFVVDISNITTTSGGQLTIGSSVQIVGTLVGDMVVVDSIQILSGPPPPQQAVIHNFTVAFDGRLYDEAANTTEFIYVVTGTGVPSDLSHFDVEVPHCDPPLELLWVFPAEAVEAGVDPTTGIDGIKWDLPLLTTESRIYSLTFTGNVALGEVSVAVKGDGFEIGMLPGASCSVADIDLEKFVSSDNAAWEDADNPPGMILDTNGQVWYRFEITNTGNVDLTNITLSDNLQNVSTCAFPGLLAPDALAECIIGPIPTADGQQTNVATASGQFGAETLTDTDSANYFVGTLPSVALAKSISIDGGTTWQDANATPGLLVSANSRVMFRFVITNNGNVPLNNLALSDSQFDLSTCTLPATLPPDDFFVCESGPHLAFEGQFTNTATVTSNANGTPLTATDSASYFGSTGPALVNGFTVTFDGREFANNQTTFTYVVSGIGLPPDLSHFDISIPLCTPRLNLIGYSPTDAVRLGNDPTTNIIGIKWDLPLKVDESRTYSITFEGDVALGNVLVAVKGGPGFETATLPGPSCDVYSIDVEKLLSIDGGLTWDDVDTAPGLDVELGTEVRFRVIVTNNGNSDLTGITLSDNVFDLSGCAVQDTLNPDAFFECEFGPFPAEEGQHTNIVTTTGTFPSGNGFTTDTDAANYFGGDRPSIIIAKAISSNYSASWNDADTAPGPSLDIGADVFFRLTVTNNGNVALTELSLSDTTFDTSSCQIPSSLEPEGSFECVLGPFQVVEGPHTNTATTSAMFDGTAVTASDDANYIGEVPVVETPVINDGDNDAGRDDDVVSDEDSQPSGDGTVTLCHIPPGNPNAAHTITVGEPAVQEHLGHGDTLGPCSGSSGGGGPPDDRGRGEGRGD